MSWISLTVADLQEAKVAALIDACSTAAKATGQEDRAAGLIQGVVNEIRRKVASCASNRVDEDTAKIPEGLRDLAVDMIIARLKKAIELSLTQDEREALARAERTLTRIADCKEVVDSPDDPITPETEAPQASPSFGTRPRYFTRDSQDG